MISNATHTKSTTLGRYALALLWFTGCSFDPSGVSLNDAASPAADASQDSGGIGDASALDAVAVDALTADALTADAVAPDAAPPACDPAMCPGLRCVSDACGYYPDCQGLFDSGLAPTSGEYDVLTAGDPAPIKAFCDMTTDGGGWTLVFIAQQSNHNRNIDDYTEKGAMEFLSGANQALLAYRNNADRSLTAGAPWARTELPMAWKVQCPTEAFGSDEMVMTFVQGDAAPTPRRLRYGWGDWGGDRCTGDWLAGTDWGRICIENSQAPYYNAFESSNGDHCPRSNQDYNETDCSGTRRFSIAVR